MAEEIGENPQRGSSAGLKLAVSGSFILALLSLGGSGYLYRSLNLETRERQALEAAQEQMRGKSVNLERNVQNYKTQIEELQAKLKENGDSQNQFLQAIEENKKVIEALQEKLKATEAVINKIPEAEPQEESEVEPEASLEIASQPPPPPVVIQPVASEPPPPPAPQPVASVPPPSTASPILTPTRNPQVLSVNRKFNFVVVGLGIKDGLQMGDGIEISRDGKVTGNAQVEKLYEKFAAATIMREEKDAPIKEGDSIRKSS